MKTNRNQRRRGFAWLPVLVVLGLLVLVWAVRRPLLSSAGTWLNNGEPPAKADAMLVLAGGLRGERVRKAAALRDAGFASVILVSSPGGYYGHPECELAIGMLEREGISKQGFECAKSHGDSTLEEARSLVPRLRERGIRRLMIISSDTHMRRGGRIWRSAMPEADIHMVSAASPHFQLARWWETREGRKAVFLEWMKVVTSLAGI